MSIWRVKNKQSGNYVSRAISAGAASTLAKQLNESKRQNIYEAVNVGELAKKNIPDKEHKITEDEVKAISCLKNIKFASTPDGNQVMFANSMLEKIHNFTPETTISEKQSAYLWHLIYHYRRQVSDRELVKLAEQNRIY